MGGRSGINGVMKGRPPHLRISQSVTMAAESGSSCSDSSDWSSGSSDDEADCRLSQLVNEKGKESEDSDSTSLDHTELDSFADVFEVNWLVRVRLELDFRLDRVQVQQHPAAHHSHSIVMLLFVDGQTMS